MKKRFIIQACGRGKAEAQSGGENKEALLHEQTSYLSGVRRATIPPGASARQLTGSRMAPGYLPPWPSIFRKSAQKI